MGRRCECAALLEAARGSPYLRLVAPAARWLWLMLVDTIMRDGGLRAGEPGVFMVGAAAGTVGDMSMMFSMEKAEAESHVESLRKVGLLDIRGDGAVMLGAAAPRPSVRANGGRAPVLGRPRKGESTEEYRRRQRELRLLAVVPQGLAESRESISESPAPAAAASSLKEESKQASGESPVPADWQRIGDRAAAAAGFDPVRWPGDYAIVRTWLAAGAGEALILEAIERVMARPRPPSPRDLRYFDGIVREAMRMARPADGGRRCPAWAVAVDKWRAEGAVGAPPDFETYWREHGERAA